MTLPPITREVVVDADPSRAFQIFTDGIGRWWPLEDLGVFGQGASVAFEGGRLVERGPDDGEAVWGTVTEWEPGSSLSMTWHPGRDAEHASQVSVRFEEQGGRTHVTLEHSGWEVYAEPAAARDEYGHGWPAVLDRYKGAVVEDPAAEASPEGDGDEATWIAVVHTAAPGLSGSVFGDPRFAEHRAWLGRMHAAGWMVAAGPLADIGSPDVTGATGMTVLRLPGTGGLDEARRQAIEDDRSVTEGLFTADIRHWEVVHDGLAGTVG